MLRNVRGRQGSTYPFHRSRYTCCPYLNDLKLDELRRNAEAFDEAGKALTYVAGVAALIVVLVIWRVM